MCESASLILFDLTLAGTMHLSFIVFVSISIPPRHALLVDFTDATKFARCHSRVLHSLPFSFLFLLPHRSRLFLDLFSSFAFTDTCHFERSRSRILHSPFYIVCIACISCIASLCLHRLHAACITCIGCIGRIICTSRTACIGCIIIIEHHVFAYLRRSLHIIASSQHMIASYLRNIFSHHMFASPHRIASSHIFAHLRVMFRMSCISSHSFANVCMAPPILTCTSSHTFAYLCPHPHLLA